MAIQGWWRLPTYGPATAAAVAAVAAVAETSDNDDNDHAGNNDDIN